MNKIEAIVRPEKLESVKEALADAGFVERLTQLQLDLADLGSLYGHFVDKARRGETLGPDVSMLKIWSMETYQRLSELLIEAAGEYGAMEGEAAIGDAVIDVLSPFYNSRPGTIYGGSNEIQRNIIAKYVLNLPS